MKSLSCFLRATLLGLALSTVLQAAPAFEGTVQMRVAEGEKPAFNLVYTVKGDHARFDMPPDPSMPGMPPTGIVYDFQKAEMIILMEMPGQQKMYMRRGLAAQTPKGSAPGKTKKTPEPTGRTDTIAGYAAKEYKGPGDQSGETVELWMASSLGRFAFPATRDPKGVSAAPGWEKFADEGGLFPLRAITRDAAGHVKSTLEVTKIDRTSVPDSLFSTDGYVPFQLPGGR